MNQYISQGCDLQKVSTLQETYFCKLTQLTQKLQSIDRLSQGTSLQVLQKENEWKEKLKKIEKEHEEKIQALTKDVESAQNDKQLISKSYESQLQMMSEHIVELNNNLQIKKDVQALGGGQGRDGLQKPGGPPKK